MFLSFWSRPRVAKIGLQSPQLCTLKFRSPETLQTLTPKTLNPKP